MRRRWPAQYATFNTASAYSRRRLGANSTFVNFDLRVLLGMHKGILQLPTSAMRLTAAHGNLSVLRPRRWRYLRRFKQNTVVPFRTHMGSAHAFHTCSVQQRLPIAAAGGKNNPAATPSPSVRDEDNTLVWDLTLYSSFQPRLHVLLP